MILAWVLSLILLCSSLVFYLERTTALMMIEVNTMKVAQQQWALAENAVLECEKSIGSISSVSERDCIIEPIQTHVWKITSKNKPGIEVHTYVDPISGQTTRLNWRQAFD